MSENPYASSTPFTPNDEKTWSIVSYVAGLFFDILAPLVAYVLFRDKGPFIAHHTKQHLNFSITLIVIYVVFIVSIIGWFFFWVPVLYAWVMRLIAAYKASQGEYFVFPFTIQFIK